MTNLQPTTTTNANSKGCFARALRELANLEDYIDLFVPGRICLIGEHSDWAGHYRRFNANVEKGYCIVSGTNQGLYARVYPHPNKLVMRCVTDTPGEVYEEEVLMEPTMLRAKAREGGFFAYCAGVAYTMSIHYQVRGLVVDNYKTDLPVKKGLSSSAAVCVLMARAFSRVYDIKLTVRGEMELAYQGEIETPSRCGRMDQCCAFGQNTVLMTFDGDHLETELINMTCQLYIVIVDLKAAKNTQEILGQLNRCYPFSQNDMEKGVHEMLGPINAKLIQQMIKAMEKGAVNEVGQIMVEYQKQFDQFLMPACPSQLTAPALHKMLAFAGAQPFVYGCKGIGSQGDGCAQFLCKSEEDQRRLIEVISRECKLPCLPLTLGAKHTVRKAIVPVAGYQSDLFPANVTGTGMFPIVDHSDGLCKPAILIIVEEAVCAGIEEVAIVVHPDDEPVYKRLFHSKMAIQKFNRLNPAGQKYYQRIQELGQSVKIVPQTKNNGFGGAVLAAAEVIGTSSPFLLLLGDHLYRSSTHESCTQQLIREFNGTPIVGLRFTPEEDVNHFGAVNGRWDEKSGILDITVFAEKPNADFARLNLLPPPQPTPASATTGPISPSKRSSSKQVQDRKRSRKDSVPSTSSASVGNYLTVFGMYILSPQLFTILEKEQAHAHSAGKSEVPLTPALDRLRQEQGFQGLVMKGERFDFGHPSTYVETISNFSAN